MNIALIGNKKQDKYYNLSNYDLIVRTNNCDSLYKTYTDKTDIWIFGGNDRIFKDNITEDIIKYISKRCKRKLVFHPHNIQNIIYGETEVIYKDVKKMCEFINYDNYNEKLDRITTTVNAILQILFIYNKQSCPIDIYCLDKDRMEKNCYHLYPQEEYKLLDFLEQNKYIRFIK